MGKINKVMNIAVSCSRTVVLEPSSIRCFGICYNRLVGSVSFPFHSGELMWLIQVSKFRLLMYSRAVDGCYLHNIT
jgi:hypothetical protein